MNINTNIDTPANKNIHKKLTQLRLTPVKNVPPTDTPSPQPSSFIVWNAPAKPTPAIIMRGISTA